MSERWRTGIARRPQELRQTSRSSRASAPTSPTASSSCSSGRPAAASRRCCAWSPGSRRSPAARSSSAIASSTKLEPKDRDIAMVFQNYALYPHMSVFENMAFGLQDPRLRQGRDRDRGSTATRPNPRAGRAARAQAARSSPAASASAWRSAAPSCASPRCSCSTSRCPTSTPSCACRCALEIEKLHRGSARRRSTSRTTRSRR